MHILEQVLGKTLYRYHDRKGPDIIILWMKVLKRSYKSNIRMVLRGDNNKILLKEEQVTIDFAFASVVLKI